MSNNERGVAKGDEKRRRPDILSVVFVISAVLLLWLEISPPHLSDDALLDELYRGILIRAIGTGLFFALMVRLGWHIFAPCPRGGRSLVEMFPALLVVLNNFPIIGLASGAARVTASAWHVAVFCVYSLLIGAFEEFAFRGVFYMLLLSEGHQSKRRIFFVTLVSSAAFGAVHLFNLLSGAGVGATLLQVGYSFLIGGMCSIVLLRTGSIWYAVILHALFDCGGYLVPMLGEGVVWDSVTVAMTAVLGVCVAVYMTWTLTRISPEQIEPMFDV